MRNLTFWNTVALSSSWSVCNVVVVWSTVVSISKLWWLLVEEELPSRMMFFVVRLWISFCVSLPLPLMNVIFDWCLVGVGRCATVASSYSMFDWQQRPHDPNHYDDDNDVFNPMQNSCILQLSSAHRGSP